MKTKATKSPSAALAATHQVISAQLEPYKAECIERAERAYLDYIERVIKPALEAGEYNINKIAPRPNGMRDSRASYLQKQRYRAEIDSLTERVPSESMSVCAPEIVKLSDERIARRVQQTREAMDADFDGYVNKLSAKIGEGVVSAEITGKLWDYSTLTVTKNDGSVERWRTQQIINVSCLGKLFNQWPTRLSK
jgi:hypothetical protein